MKTTYTAGVDLFLVDGEICVVDIKSPFLKTEPYYYELKIEEYILGNNAVKNYVLKGNMGFTITHSTKQIDGIHLLDRNIFIKGNNVIKIGCDSADENYLLADPKKTHYILGFKAGYKANKNEFTREEMEKAFMAGIKSVTAPGFWYKIFNEFVSELRPLSLPNSVTIENNEIIEVKWTEK